MASGDDAQDEECYRWIRAELDRGNEWAWCMVTVVARLETTVKRNGRVDEVVTIEGRDYLGGCSYKSEKDFREPGDYFDDMKVGALADLQAKVDAMRALVCEEANP